MNVHMQAVESFNNQLKQVIKERAGVQTDNRERFLKQFGFLLNNRENLFGSIPNLIKYWFLIFFQYEFL